MVLLYFLYYNQTDPVKSLRLGMGIIAIVLLSLIKNISVIFVITIKDVYIKFRTWFHKKINHKERRQRRLKEEAQKHAEKEQKEKEDRDLLKYGKIMHTTNVQAFNSNDVIAKTSTPRSTSNERLNNLVKDIKGIKKSDQRRKFSKRKKTRRKKSSSNDSPLSKYQRRNNITEGNLFNLETIHE